MAVKPVVDTSKPANPPAQAAAQAAGNGNTTALELGGGALALLAIGAGAYAMTRRRRLDEEVIDEAYEPETTADETVAAADPVTAPMRDPIFDEQPAIVAPDASAFAWGNPQPAAQDSEDESDRRPGETWVERAYRGPSPANPSVSLRARLKRAAFFDKREREVEAGEAEPVDTDAGLPEAMADEQQVDSERELA